MYRIFILIALLPSWIQAATPFVSVGLAPNVSVFKYPITTHEPVEYDNTFLAVGGTLSAGVRAARHEWYARFTWSNSEGAKHDARSSAYFEDVASVYTTYSAVDHWHDQRLVLGHRWLLMQSKPQPLVGFIGLGLATGRTKWQQSSFQTTELYDPESFDVYRTTSSRTSSKRSAYSFGGATEIGGRVLLWKNLSFETSAQLGVNYTVIQENGSDFGLRYNQGGTVIEPSLRMALRWDFKQALD